MKRVWSLLLLLAIVLSPVLAGGQGEAGGEAEEVTSIRMWHTYTQPARVKGMKKMAEEFERETGIKVEIEVQTWGGVTQKWPMAFAAGTLPDILTCVPSDAMAMWAVGATAPVNRVIDELGGPESFIAYLDEWNDNGDYIAYPFYGMARILTYRKSFLKEIGLDSPPKTWSELLDAAVKLNNPPARYGFIPSLKTGSKEAAYILYALTYQLGGELWDEDLNPTLDTPEVIKAVKYMTELWSKAAPKDPFAYATDNETQIWTAGLTSFLFNGVPVKILSYNLNKEVFHDTSVALLPVPDGMSPEKTTNYTSPRLMVLVNSSDAKRKVAEDFMIFMNQHERKLKFMKTNAFMFPVLKTISEDSRFIDDDEVRSQMRDEIEMTFKGMSIGRTGGLEHGINPYSFLMESNSIELMFQKILSENIPVEQAVKEAQQSLFKKVQEQKALLGR